MTKGKKPDPDQLGIDFSSRSAERFALLRSLDIGISAEASHVGYLLELIAGIAGDGEFDWTLERISQRLRLPEPTLKRAVALAEGIGAITVRRLRRGDGSYGTNALAVNWSRIAAGSVERIDGWKGRRSHRSQRSDRQITMSCPTAHSDPASSPSFLPQNNKPPPPPRDVVLAPDSSGTGMAAAVVRLCGLGVADASAACRQAAAAGVTADVVLALAEHFAARPGAWGPGALHYRVRSAVPGLAIDEGWPPPAKGWIPQPERTLRDRALADQQAAQAATAAAAAELSAQRERQWGPQLDQLSDEQVQELAAAEPFIAERLRRNGRHSPLVRQWLLAELSRSRTVAGTGEDGKFYIGRTAGSGAAPREGLS